MGDDFLEAKAFLSKTSTATGVSVYDHLSAVITKLLDERPNNAVDILEELSSQTKQEAFKDTSSTIKVLPSAAQLGIDFSFSPPFNRTVPKCLLWLTWPSSRSPFSKMTAVAATMRRQSRQTLSKHCRVSKKAVLVLGSLRPSACPSQSRSLQPSSPLSKSASGVCCCVDIMVCVGSFV